MEKIIRKSFSCDSDFDRVNDFLSKTYISGGMNIWDNARWSFNRYCIHSEEELSNNRVWEKSVQLWEDNDGQIIAVAHIEEPGDYFFQVHPGYKYLEEEMIIWAIDNCRKNYPTLNKIVVTSCQNDFERKKLYSKYQAVKHDYIDVTRIVELKNEYPLQILPNDYRIINLDAENLEACKKVSDLYTNIWPTSRYMSKGETVASMTKSIAYKKELSFIIIDDKEQYVAFTIAWVDTLNKMAHFYPVAVDPNYLKLNFLECLLINALNTLITLSYEKATISASYSEDEDRIFEKLGFVKNSFDEIYNVSILKGEK